jgi:hypothetical protein
LVPGFGQVGRTGWCADSWGRATTTLVSLSLSISMLSLLIRVVETNGRFLTDSHHTAAATHERQNKERQRQYVRQHVPLVVRPVGDAHRFGPHRLLVRLIPTQ